MAQQSGETPDFANRPPATFQFAFPPPPEFYADSFGTMESVYTFSLVFGVQVGQEAYREVAVVRMSPQHAKMMAILLKRRLKEYEQQVGQIIIPDDLLELKNVDLGRDWDGV
jgi:hypothetical protein